MKILFEDEHLVVCFKPAGVLSQEAPGRANMVALLRESTSSEIFPVHRLDREADGVMVFAKTKAAAAALCAQITAHSFEKIYLARVHGVPDPPAGVWEDLLFKDSAKNKVYTVKRQRRGLKAAKLAYEVLSSDDGDALVRITLFTGRTHQIRVQFASRRHPLRGDRKYGARDAEEKLQLHAHALSFNHPATKARMTFSIPAEDLLSAASASPSKIQAPASAPTDR